MPEELFIGGAHAGWREVPPARNVIMLPKPMPPVMFQAIEGPPLALDFRESVVTYTRRRWFGSGWRIVLPIWTCDEEMPGPHPEIPPGTVLPGVVQNRLPEYEPINKADARAYRRAKTPDV